MYLLSHLTSVEPADTFRNANEYSGSYYSEVATYIRLPCKATGCLNQSFCPHLKCNPSPSPQVSWVPCFSHVRDAALLQTKKCLLAGEQCISC